MEEVAFVFYTTYIKNKGQKDSSQRPLSADEIKLDSCYISSPGNEDIGHISTNPNKLTKAEIIFYWQIILLVLHLGLAGTSLLLQRVHKEVGGNLLHQSTHHPLLLAEPGGVALVVLHGVTHPGGPRGLLPHYDGLQVPGVPSGAVLLSSLPRLGQHTEISHHLNPRSHLLQRSPPLDLQSVSLHLRQPNISKLCKLFCHLFCFSSRLILREQ